MAAAPKNPSFSLCDARDGDVLTVSAVDSAKMFVRVAEMGMVPGTRLEVRRGQGRAVIVQLRGATLAIDSGLCAGVYVVAAPN